MLKVYYEKTYVSLDGEDWLRIGGVDEVIIDEKDFVNDKTIFEDISFDECFEFLCKNSIWGLSRDYTVFKKRPVVCVKPSFEFEPHRYTYFDTISCKSIYEEKTNVNLKYVIERFPAEQAIQWFKERGINTCPINFNM